MSEYFSKQFFDAEDLDAWLRFLQKPGYGTSIVGYAALPPTYGLFVTVKRWKLRETPGMAMHSGNIATIIPPQMHPEEESIQYPDGGEDEQDHTNK